MATVLQLCNAAAEELEVIPSGGSLTTAEQASALDRYNRMIDAGNLDRALIWSERIDQLTLISGQQHYTIGATGNLAIERPVRIVRANLFLTSLIRTPIAILTPEQWANIEYQSVQGPPQGLYYDGAFSSAGLGSVYFFMTPDQAYDIELYSWVQNAQAATIGATISYPPGYADYWLYALAIRLAPMFGRSPSADLRESFRVAREAVVANNSPSPLLHTDAGFLNSGEAWYDWRVGKMR